MLASLVTMSDAFRVCPTCQRRLSGRGRFCPIDGTPLPAASPEQTNDPYVGLVLAKTFVLLRLIGVGATGRVYQAHQRDLNRSVAVKIIHRRQMEIRETRERFHREARAVGQLVHPAIAQPLLTGEVEASAPGVGGEAYLVSELVDGISLRACLLERGRLPWKAAIPILLVVADAVGQAHQMGIVHRDLKPENIMLAPGFPDMRRVVVLDFGLARFANHEAAELTRDGDVVGTARYISPEGARGETATPRSDVYSMATVLYECLAGHPPFSGPSAVSVLMQHVEAPVPALDSGLQVPEALATFVLTHLDKSPERRAEDATAWGSSLLRLLRDLEPSRSVLPLASCLPRLLLGSIDDNRTRRYGSPSGEQTP